MSMLKVTLSKLTKLTLVLVFVVGSVLLSVGGASAEEPCEVDPAVPLKCFCEEARDNSAYRDSDTNKNICQLNDVDKDSDSKEGLLNENGIIKKIFNLLSWLTGLLAAVYLIIGGAKIIASGGNSDSVASGKKMIIYALVGIVVVVSSNIIINFVIGLVNNAGK